MNIYGIIILVTLLLNALLGYLADWLNLGHLKEELPGEFGDLLDADAYGRSQAYTRTKTRFGFITGSFDLAVMLLFWFAGGFNYLDVLARGWGLGLIWTGLIYMAILMLIKGVIDLPFGIYSTFVIEERFGFNRTTPKIFITDILKGLVLAVLLGAPLMALFIALFEYAGPGAWFYCWVAVTLFTLFVQFIAPTWIMPLFNKFKPIEDGELKEAVFSYAKSVDFSLQNLFVMDGSKRSSKSNAFFTGFGKNKRIALFDTLVEAHSVPELVAVLAHEIGHYKKKHILQGMVIGILYSGVMLYLLSIFVSHKGLFDAFYMEQTSIYVGLIFFGLLFTPIEMILSVLMHMLSRKNEYEADRFAAETTGNGEDLIASLKKLSVNNLSNLTPHPLYVFLHYSHPPLMERIRALRGGALKGDQSHL